MKEKFFTILFFLVVFSVFPQKKHKKTNKTNKIGDWDIRKGIFIDKNQKENNLAKDNWKVFYNIFPKRITQRYIKKIELISDGIDEKTGALGALSLDNTQWQLVIDTLDVNFKSKNKERVYQSVYTLIHEFGHLITLNNKQIKPVLKKKKESFGLVEDDSEEKYVTIEGQALKNSYVNLFVRRFWSGGLLKEWDFIQKKYCFVEQQSCLDKLYGLYKDNYTDFVTDYAAESPEEDIAESWTYFVLEDKVENPETVAQQKINFFYQFPELVRYRKIIKKNISKYLK